MSCTGLLSLASRLELYSFLVRAGKVMARLFWRVLALAFTARICDKNQALIDARRSLVTVLHTSCQTILERMRKQMLIKIYHVVQGLYAFSSTDLCRPDRCSTKPRHRFAYQCLSNIKMYKHAAFYLTCEHYHLNTSTGPN